MWGGDVRGGWVDPACPIEWGHPLNQGLVGAWLSVPNPGWWGGKYAYDAVRGGQKPNDGTLTNGPQWRPGHARSPAVFFDGTNDYVTIPSSTVFDSSTLTVSFLMWTDGSWNTDGGSAGDAAPLIVRHDSSGSINGFGIYAIKTGASAGKLSVQSKGAVNSTINITTTNTYSVLSSSWRHVAVSMSRDSGGPTTAYVDGAACGTANASAAWSFNSQAVRLGVSPDTFWEEYKGLMSDVRWYNRILTSSEIFALYDQSRRGHPDTMRWVSTRAYSLPQSAGGSTSITAVVGTYGIAGTAANFLRGIVMPSAVGSYSLSGQSVAVKAGRKTSMEVGDYTLSGVDALFSRTYSIGAAIGSYTLSGVISSLLKTSILAAAVGSYVLNGVAAALTADKLIVAAVGAYTLNGVDATLTESGGLPVLSAEPGSYTLNGTVASLLADKTVTAAPGSYTLSGQDASFLRGLVVNADVGTYALNGVDAGLLKSSSFNADIGQYTINGVSANLTATRLLPAEVGNYTLNGVASFLHHDHAIVASPGSYVLNGVDAILSYSGQVYILDAAAGEYTITGLSATFIIVRADNHRIVWRCGAVHSIIVDGSKDGNRVVWRGDV